MHGCRDLEILLDLSNFKKLNKLDKLWCEKLTEISSIGQITTKKFTKKTNLFLFSMSSFRTIIHYR
ncbi:hypothetical protein LguiB_006186 [Lonicera macranthoides]